MAKKSKSVSINAFERAMDECQTGAIILWNNIEIYVKFNLGIDDMVGFVNDLVKSCFDDNGVYQPEAFAFSMRLNILSRYGNITLPKDLAKRYEFAYSGAADEIRKYINFEQINDIEEAAKAKIDHILDTNATEVVRELAQIVDVFKQINNGIGDSFNDVSIAEINDVIAKLSKIDNVREDTIVSAVLALREKQ